MGPRLVVGWCQVVGKNMTRIVSAPRGDILQLLLDLCCIESCGECDYHVRLAEFSAWTATKLVLCRKVPM